MRLKSITGGPVQVALLSSHTIVVPPEGREVPQMFLAEALKLGCVPADMEVEDLQPAIAILTGDQKISVIADAMKVLLNRGCRLTGAGLPNMKDLAAEVGFPVNKEEAAEAFNVLKAEAEESQEENTPGTDEALA